MSWGRESVCLLRWQIIYWRNNFFHFVRDVFFYPVFVCDIFLKRAGIFFLEKRESCFSQDFS